MRRASPPGRAPVFDRLDRAAACLNPLLMVVAIILGIIPLSGWAALELGHLQPLRHHAVQPTAGSAGGRGGVA